MSSPPPPQWSANHVAATEATVVHNRNWWLRMAAYTLCVLFGQTSATLLIRLYYNKGGKTVWLTSLVETVGFPILVPFYLYFRPLTRQQLTENNNRTSNPPSLLILSAIYISLGVLQSLSSILYSVGLFYLPLSTFSLISTTQLAFNAFFSYFLNAQKLTHLIINSLVLLTISAVLLVLQGNSEETQVGMSRKKSLKVGFICTIAASAIYSLGLSLTQLAFQKVIKDETFRTVLNMIIYQSLVASIVTIMALFISGQWNDLSSEMMSFELGKIIYLIIITSIAVCWQISTIGAVGLIFEVSSLFSNVISTLALPIIPILAVIIYHEKMNAMKAIATVLAIWGFGSYVYQHYLDESQPTNGSEPTNGNEPTNGSEAVDEVSPT